MLTKQQDVRRCCSVGRIWNKLEEEEDEQCLSRENKTGIALRLVWFFFEWETEERPREEPGV